MANVAVKRVGPHHPGRRRAGCPHPAGPPAGAKTPGGYGIRPYDRRRAPRPTGKLRPCHTTNPCRGRYLHRPAHPASPQGPAGGINPAPTNKFCVSGQTGTAAPHRADVGRDALIPPGLPPPRKPPVLNRRGAAGVNARPTEPGKHGGQPGAPHRRNPCRGRCSHRPAGREAFCGTMLASSRAPRLAARPRGRDKSRPYEQILCFGPNRNGRSPPGGRRAGCPHPAGPLAGANTPGGYGIRPHEQILCFGPNRNGRGQFLIPHS